MINNKKLKDSNKSYMLIFTGLFLVVACIVFLPFIIENKSFIWLSDGTDQHYTALIYYSHYLRSIIKRLVTTGKFTLPMWDFKIGQGSDIIITLHYYCLGDPLALLAVLFPQKYMTYCYNFLILFRLYLSGLTFSAYCFYLKKDKVPVLIGAFVYMFCGFSLVYMRHPFFLNPLIYLPLLFIGIEKILKKQSFLFFTAMVFLSAISNFYFFFMLTIIAFIYAIVRYFSIEAMDRKLKTFMQLIFKGILSYLLGIAMAAIILLPIVLVMKGTSRYSESGTGLFLYYPLDYFRKVFLSFVYIAGESYWNYRNAFKNTIPSNSYWSCLGYAATAIIIVVLMFTIKTSKFKSIRIGFIICMVFLALPIVGYTFNGFAYVSNRWIFALSFVMAISFTLISPYLEGEVSGVSWIACTIWVAVLAIICSLSLIKGFRTDFVGVIVAAAILFVLYICHKYRKKLGDNSLLYIFAGLTLISICINGNLLYNKQFGNVINEYSYNDEYRKGILSSPLRAAKKIKDSSFYRVDTYRYETKKAGELDGLSSNESMLLGYRGLGSYFSLINPNYSNLIQELDVIGILSPHRIYNLDNRTALNALAAVKYCIETENDKADIPYGYKFVKKIAAPQEKAVLYKNKYSLPLAYCYDSYMKLKDYEKLNPIDKQQAMLEKVILDDSARTGKLTRGSYLSETVNVPFEKSKKNTLVPEYNKVYDAQEYSMKALPNSETYLYLKDVNFEGDSRVNVIAQTKNTIKFAKYYGKTDVYYYGRKDVVINLGYSKKGISNFIVYTDREGKLSYSKMKVISVPMRDYADKIKRLKADSMNQIKISENSITGSITLHKGKMLCLAIPYSSGWRAQVDGKSAQLYKANLMYMAIPLDAGSHKIELKYQTPGLIPGRLISALAIVVYVILFIINLFKEPKR